MKWNPPSGCIGLVPGERIGTAISPPPPAASPAHRVPGFIGWIGLVRARIDLRPRELNLFPETTAMRTPPRPVIKTPARPPRGLQQQSTKGPVKVVVRRAPTEGAYNSGGQSGNGWVQQDEQS